MKRTEQGFTVIELIVVVVLLATASMVFFVQKNNLTEANNDERRKIAINAIYYNLEEVFYPKNGYYPAEISADNLHAVDPDLLTDVRGVKLGEQLDISDMDQKSKDALAGQDLHLSEYRYLPSDCSADGKCKSYKLTVKLQKEAEYVKENRHHNK